MKSRRLANRKGRRLNSFTLPVFILVVVAFVSITMIELGVAFHIELTRTLVQKAMQAGAVLWVVFLVWEIVRAAEGNSGEGDEVGFVFVTIFAFNAVAGIFNRNILDLCSTLTMNATVWSMCSVAIIWWFSQKLRDHYLTPAKP